MVDQIAKLFFLPVFPRWPVTIFYEVDRYNIANKLARIRFEKREWLIPVSIDVLNTIFKVGLHYSIMFFKKFARQKPRPESPADVASTAAI
jgi:hypothetical protein